MIGLRLTLGDGWAAVFSRYRFVLVQILRSMRPPSGLNSGPSIRIQPFGRTCQSQLITVPSPSAAKVSASPTACLCHPKMPFDAGLVHPRAGSAPRSRGRAADG